MLLSTRTDAGHGVLAKLATPRLRFSRGGGERDEPNFTSKIEAHE
jgi:hypothetical protein